MSVQPEPFSVGSPNVLERSTFGAVLRRVENQTEVHCQFHRCLDHTIVLTINGHTDTNCRAPWVTLLDLMRERMHLSGAKKGLRSGTMRKPCTVSSTASHHSCCVGGSGDGAEIHHAGRARKTQASFHPCRQLHRARTTSNVAIARRGKFARGWTAATKHTPAQARDSRNRERQHSAGCGATPTSQTPSRKFLRRSRKQRVRNEPLD